MTSPDQFLLTWVFPPLAFWILLSGVDDVLIDLAQAWLWLRGHLQPENKVTSEDLRNAPQTNIAVFVALWHEHEVIGSMLRHNLAAIPYHNYHFFVGTYPNDEPTMQAVREVEKQYANVHISICPHPGPTSKADCLNWVYQRMKLFEEERDVRFDIIVMHDAEDLIHPLAFSYLNYYHGQYDMVQVPVLPLPTPVRQLTHGIYCDEFAEFQSRDMNVRCQFGGFVPSCGVGTGFSREALESLASPLDPQVIFNPSSLTEDYECGLRLSRMGYRQLFVPVQSREGSFVATREYFPSMFYSALRQRTRWVMGISLQGWEHHNWAGSPKQWYWLWRDRKGLIGNPVSVLTNILFLYGIITLLIARSVGKPWGLEALLESGFWPSILAFNAWMQTIRTAFRVLYVRRIYGLRFALFVPVRVFYANILNASAVIWAAWRYFKGRWSGKRLEWLKTTHAYPNRSVLITAQRSLSEILITIGAVTEADLEMAKAMLPEGTSVEGFLVECGAITEEQLAEAIGLQQGLPLKEVALEEAAMEVGRMLPADLMERWQMVPFRVADGSLYVASPLPPSEELQKEIRRYTRLEPRFHLMTARNYDRLQGSW